jgi:hypothetical protein
MAESKPWSLITSWVNASATVQALQGQTSKEKPVVDPLLESILKNNEDSRPLEDVKTFG